MYNVLKLSQTLRWILWQWDLIIYMLNNSAEKPPLPALTLQHKETLTNTYSHSWVRDDLHNKGRGNGELQKNEEIRNIRPSQWLGRLRLMLKRCWKHYNQTFLFLFTWLFGFSVETKRHQHESNVSIMSEEKRGFGHTVSRFKEPHYPSIFGSFSFHFIKIATFASMSSRCHQCDPAEEMMRKGLKKFSGFSTTLSILQTSMFMFTVTDLHLKSMLQGLTEGLNSLKSPWKFLIFPFHTDFNEQFLCLLMNIPKFGFNKDALRVCLHDNDVL